MKKVLICLFFSVLPLLVLAGPIEQMLRRIAPGQEKHFQFVLDPGKGSKSFFEITRNKERIRIRGNSYVSIASGLNWYLTNCCHVSYSDCDSVLSLPKPLPYPESRIYKETFMQVGYTECRNLEYFFWKWENWEKEIDRLALLGVNVVYTPIGEAPVWNEFLNRYRLPQKETDRFLYGTENVPGFWYKRQEKIYKKIMRRMQSLGMIPVFRVFNGNIPKELAAQNTLWTTCEATNPVGVFSNEVLLATDDPQFHSVANKWYAAWNGTYGSSPFYYGDYEPAQQLKYVQQTLNRKEEKATIILPCGGNGIESDFKERNLEREVLSGDPKKILLIYRDGIDEADWRMLPSIKNSFWIWTWGDKRKNGKTPVSLATASEQPVQTANNPETASLISGTGMLLNRNASPALIHDFVHSLRWQPEVISMTDRVKQLVENRYGRKNQAMNDAWTELMKLSLDYDLTHSIAAQRPDRTGIQMHEHPDSLKQTSRALARILSIMLGERENLPNADACKKDLLQTAMLLCEQELKIRFTRIHAEAPESNKEDMRKAQDEFLELILLNDSLRMPLTDLCWSNWTEKIVAENKKDTTDIALWSKTLLRHEENRTGCVPALSGILSDYCYPRWELYFNWQMRQRSGMHVAFPQYDSMEEAWYRHKETTRIKETDKKGWLKNVIKVLEIASK